ncbi:MAG: flagellar motor switch protein FliM [Ignavibacteriota bacterium]|nr:flagellar motor switch protein FliM [Ignavibacteriota bacterium]MBW7841563.1 flagellar motor switch protein FliM [Ignavibacterium sp.]MCO6448218.1 flagellar motor switch protein FliM [Ignavibacterium album]MCZ2268002.1 flagellar motor switch protein FliM [Ignavibacteriales bacterium]HOJ06337.1 flagellar motor switch protein FliM [Ignavibacteriaceae bacterium]
MSEVLSQSEIDALLKSGGEALPQIQVEEEIIPYDFRLPNRISKTQLRTIRNIHENFAESLSSFLVTKLQTVVNIKVNSIDQIYYSEYVLSVSNPACLYTFHIKNTDIKGILELNTDLALTLVDRLLGGNGSSKKQSNNITLIEQKVLSVIVEKVMGDLKRTWQIIENMEFIVDHFEPDIDFVQLTSPNESVLLISFEFSFGEESHLMNICFATFAFDAILAKMSSQKLSSSMSSRNQGKPTKELISRHLNQTNVPVTVELGTSTISIKELADLKKGDVIVLENKIHDEHIIKVYNKVLFLGHPGISNNHKAIKITKSLIGKNSL